jgi:DNA-directed RNA polymerase specialized sigma24 family protein
MSPERLATVPVAADAAALVEAVRSGDPAAFEAFYRRYESAVYRTALALVRDGSTAEEIVVDTFVRAHPACRRLDLSARRSPGCRASRSTSPSAR